MSDQGVRKVVAIILIVIGAIIVIGVLGMWLMHSMMGGMMAGGMMGSMAGSMMGCMAMCVVGPLLLAALLVVMGIVLLRNHARNGGTQ